MESIETPLKTQILLYSILFLLFAYWPPVLFGHGVIFVIQLILARVALFLYGATINPKLLRLVMFLALMHLLAVLLGSYYLELDFGNIITLFVSLTFVSAIPFTIFATYYTRFINFICLFSLITFSINCVLPSIFSFLPEVDATVRANNLIFSLVPVGMEAYLRNFGLWGEPGMFGVYIILATALELFYIKPINWKHIIVIVLTVISTFSTATYISFIILYIFFILSSDRVSRKYKYLIVSFTVIVVLMISNFILMEGNHAYVFSKLTETDSEVGTTFERIRALETAWSLLWEYFPTGCGWGVYSKYLLDETTILTVTPLNWFAVYGVIYGVVMNFGLYLGAKAIGKKSFLTLGIALAVYSVIFSQEVSSVYIAVIPIFYAFQSYFDTKEQALCDTM